MKRIKLYKDYLKENKFSYDNLGDDFLHTFNKYADKNDYKIVKDKIVSNINLDWEYKTSLHLHKILNKNNIVIKNYNDIYKYTPEQYVSKFGCEGFNSEEDAIEYLNDILNTDFPLGLKNFPDEAILYRALFVKNPAKVSTKNFGVHYTSDIDVIDNDFLGTIGGDNFDWDETPPYIFKIKMDRNQVDFYYTINNNLIYPHEYEITTKSKNPKVEIIGYKAYEETDNDNLYESINIENNYNKFPLSALVKQSRNFGNFKEFSSFYSLDIYHGYYWHLTDNPDFVISSEGGPRDMSSMSKGTVSENGAIMLTSDLAYWDEYYNTDYNTQKKNVKRNYVALFDASDIAPIHLKQVDRGFGNEVYLSAPIAKNLKQIGVYNLKYAKALDRKFHNMIPQSEKALLDIWNYANNK